MVKVGTVGGGQAIGAEALVPQGLIAGHAVPVVEVIHNLIGGVYINGGDLNGVIVDLLDADIFPRSGDAALCILHGILLGIHDGDGVAGQEGAHAGHHHGVKLLLEGEHKGVRIDGIAVVPLCILANLDLPVVIVNLDGFFGGDVANPNVAVALFVGILTIQVAHAIGGDIFDGGINVIKEVKAGMIGAEHGIINFLGRFRGLIDRSGGFCRCAGSGVFGRSRIWRSLRRSGGTARGQYANYEYHGQKECNDFLHFGFLSFFI